MVFQCVCKINYGLYMYLISSWPPKFVLFWRGKFLSITKILQDKSNLGISKNDFQMVEAKKAFVKGSLSTEYMLKLFKALFLDFASNIRMQNIFNALFLEPAWNIQNIHIIEFKLGMYQFGSFIPNVEKEFKTLEMLVVNSS